MAKSDKSGKDSLVVTVVSTAGALAAASVARRTVRLTWKAVTGQPPPDDAAHSRETDWVVAVLWAVASGAAVGVARLMVDRQLVSRISSDD